MKTNLKSEIPNVMLFVGQAMSALQMQGKLREDWYDPFYYLTDMQRYSFDQDIRAATIIYCMLREVALLFADQIEKSLGRRVREIVQDIPIEHSYQCGRDYADKQVEEDFRKLVSCKPETVLIICGFTLGHLRLMEKTSKSDPKEYLDLLRRLDLSPARTVWFIDLAIDAIKPCQHSVVKKASDECESKWQKLRPQLENL